jgi:hypothetical protein
MEIFIYIDYFLEYKEIYIDNDIINSFIGSYIKIHFYNKTNKYHSILLFKNSTLKDRIVVNTYYSYHE